MSVEEIMNEYKSITSREIFNYAYDDDSFRIDYYDDLFVEFLFDKIDKLSQLIKSDKE